MISFKKKHGIFLFVFFINFAFLNLHAKSKAKLSLEQGASVFDSHSFDLNSSKEIGIIEEIDTFKGYLKLSRTDIHIPGSNGLDLDIVHSYTGSRLYSNLELRFWMEYEYNENIYIGRLY